MAMPGYRVTVDIYADGQDDLCRASGYIRDVVEDAMMNEGGGIYAFRVTGAFPCDLDDIPEASDEEEEPRP